MKVIYPYVMAVILLIILSSCTSITEFKYKAKEFAEISINENEKFMTFDNSIKIKCINGEFYYLEDWVLDAANLIISGNGHAKVSYHTVSRGFIVLNLNPEDTIHINITEFRTLETILLGLPIIALSVLAYYMRGFIGSWKFVDPKE